MKKKRLIGGCILFLLLCVLVYFLAPVSRLEIHSIDVIQDFSNQREKISDKECIEEVISTLNRCTIRRTAYMKFPEVSACDFEAMMLGTHRDSTVQVQMICYADGRSFFRVGSSKIIYTTYDCEGLYDMMRR